MTAEDLFEQFRAFLPKYLSPADSRQLFSELSQFPSGKAFYLFRQSDDGVLQGDAWKGLVAIDFMTAGRKTVSGVVLSNSCDVDSENKRNYPVKILFSPLITLAKYLDYLSKGGVSESRIQTIGDDIRRQYVTSIFYLPGISGKIDESIILLDDIHHHPLDNFVKTERELGFRLSQYGFYLLLLKLSIHFCRFQEGVRRFDTR